MGLVEDNGPRNPRGTIGLSIALDRFLKAKWPNGERPISELRKRWTAALALQKVWDLAPDGPLLRLVAGPKELRTTSRLQDRFGDRSETKRRFLREARYALADRMEREICRVQERECIEFIEAFRTGTLVAIGAQESVVEVERWSDARAKVRSLWDDPVIHGFDYSWDALYVAEAPFDRWLKSIGPVGMGGAYSPSQAQTLAVLQTLTFFGGLAEVDADGIARRWGYPGLREPAQETDRFQKTGMPGRSSSKPLVERLFAERIASGELEATLPGEAAWLATLVQKQAKLGWPPISPRTVENHIRAQFYAAKKASTSAAR